MRIARWLILNRRLFTLLLSLVLFPIAQSSSSIHPAETPSAPPRTSGADPLISFNVSRGDTDLPGESIDSTKYVVDYAIQLGAFSMRKNAEKLKNKILKAGYTVDIYPNLLNGKQTLYLVWVGSYKNAADAEPDRAAILQKFKIDGVIRPRSAAEHH